MVNLSVFSAVPDDGDNFYVFTNGNKSKVVYSLDKIDKLTFGDQSMSVWSNNRRTDYSYSSISLMTFRENIMQTVGLEEVDSPTNEIKISYDRTTEMVVVKSEKQLSGIMVYNVQGKTIAKNLSRGYEYRCSLGAAPSGVYIIRLLDMDKESTVKIVK